MAENDRQAVETQPAATEGERRRPERSSRSNQGRSGGRGGRSDDRERGSRGRSRGRPRGGRRGKKVCTFCADKIAVIDYKDVSLLRNFVSEHGKIKARRRTGTCAKHQRRLASAIKRARHVAFLPYSAEHARGR